MKIIEIWDDGRLAIVQEVLSDGCLTYDVIYDDRKFYCDSEESAIEVFGFLKSMIKSGKII